MKFVITHSTGITHREPFPETTVEQYLKYIRSMSRSIYTGYVGVYLLNRVGVGGQELYFPFVDVDGDLSLEGDERVEDAGVRMLLTLKTFERLGVGDRFRIIARGDGGYLLVSNVLIDKDTYMAFADFIRSEMPHILKPPPANDLHTPIRLFAYLGNDRQSNNPIDSHSLQIPAKSVTDGFPSADEYQRLTQGKLDPHEVISSLKRVLDFVQVTDLNVLKGLGTKLIEYRQALRNIKVTPFEYVSFKRKSEPVSLEAMHEILTGRGFRCRIEKRGKNYAISFQGFPCPMCKKPKANARAYPPSYTLKCFNPYCAAHDGVALKVWAGFRAPGQRSADKKGKSLLPTLPKKYTTLEDARDMIRRELDNPDNVLVLVTPGVGKSHVTQEYLARHMTGKTVLYSCFNRDLQREAYDRIKSFSDSPDNVHLLQSREDLCYRKQDLNDVTRRGFSPAEILCTRCAHRKSCSYYEQREETKPGIYVVTHHMLRYLEPRFPAPHLIVLDENLIDGFRLEDSCSEQQMRTLALGLKPHEFNLVSEILHLAQSLAVQAAQTKTPMILNARKLTGSDIMEDSVVGLLARQKGIPDEEIIERARELAFNLVNTSHRKLYEMGVDHRAITWMKGLFENHITSFLNIGPSGELRFAVKVVTPLQYHDTPIKVLDATGDPRTVGRLTGRSIRAARADVHWNSHRVHIKINTSRSVLKHTREPDLRRLVKEMLEHITADKVMVVTYKSLSKQVLEICSQVEPSKEFMDYYFLGPRGINRFKECGAVLVIGLPYRNLNNSLQDAHILLPRNSDEPLRETWVDANMLWELIQNVHRVRPVNKASTEIVIASNYWPTVLEEPDTVIDKSRNKNWEEEAIARLEPFVRELGFINADVGYLANVYLKVKESVAQTFRRKFIDVINANLMFKYNRSTANNTPIWMLGNKVLGLEYLTNGLNQTNEKLKLSFKLILVIYIYYYLNLLCIQTICPPNILRCLDLVKNKDINSNIPISNTLQWSNIVEYFKQKYITFEEFKIRLPHTRNQFSKGLGHKEKVVAFYHDLNKYQIFGRVDTNTYIRTGLAANILDRTPIPDDRLVLYFPDSCSFYAYAGYANKVEPIELSRVVEKIHEITNENELGNHTIIITNDGKLTSSLFSESKLKLEIHDIILTENIMQNGSENDHIQSIEDVLALHECTKPNDSEGTVYSMSDVYEMQMKKVKALDLEKTYELESRCIPITAAIEHSGIQIDPIKMIEYEDSLLSSDTTDKAGEYTLKTLKRYMDLAGDDYRIRDQVNQLGTVTGRMTRELQKVQKSGPMRSFFIPRDGYCFVIADYSQFELRIIAGLSNEQGLIRIFKRDGDAYSEVACALFGKDKGRDPEMRKLAKVIILGLNNGMTPYGVHRELENGGFKVSLDKVQDFVQRYYALFPRIQKWRDRTVKEAHENGFVRTPLGRIRWVTRDTKYNRIINFPVQGTASDGFKMSLIEMHERLEDLDAKIVHVIHDEVIVEARENQAEDVSGIVKRCMEDAMNKLIPNVPFKVKPEIRSAWGMPKNLDSATGGKTGRGIIRDLQLGARRLQKVEGTKVRAL